jgi:hypothetical protein
MQSYVMNSTNLYSICGTFATHVMALSSLTLDPFGLLSPGWTTRLARAYYLYTDWIYGC